MLARRLGKQRIVAETGAGQHGVATATVCARFGLECVVYMGAEDMRRQAPNVERMHLLGAEVRPVEFGTRTLKEATSEAIRDWITNVETTHYLIGSCVGPAPYPELVRDLQRVIGDEAREQFLAAEGRLPEAVVACVGGGSNAIGIFYGFLDDADVRLVGVEAAGAASLGTGRTAVLHGARSSVLADDDGQIADAHSISAGLDYPGVGPEHAALRDSGRAVVRAVHRRGGARRLPPSRGDRGDHPRARELPRARARARPRRGARRRLPFRPRRQGSRRGPRARVSKKLVIYLVCEPETPELAEAAVEGGADIVELGVPFSDPLAEGPTIRLASERALARGMRTKECLECIAADASRVDVPLVPMTYAAILEAYGYERFVDRLARGRRDERDRRRPAGRGASARCRGSSSSRRRRPTSGSPRAPRAPTAGSTSSRSPGRPARATTSPPRSPASSSATRALTDVPLYAGFGISTPEHAAAVAELADGVVVGSRAVQVAEEGPAALRDYVAQPSAPRS